MKTGLCPTCGHQTVSYDRCKYGQTFRDVLECNNRGCNWFITSINPDYNRVHNQVFSAVTADEQQDRKAAQIERVVGYWDNRCAAISPVGRVSGCGTRVEGHCDVRD